MHCPFPAPRYATPSRVRPSIVFAFHHMASRKREKHEQHGIGVPRQRDEMIATGSGSEVCQHDLGFIAKTRQRVTDIVNR